MTAIDMCLKMFLCFLLCYLFSFQSVFTHFNDSNAQTNYNSFDELINRLNSRNDSGLDISAISIMLQSLNKNVSFFCYFIKTYFKKKHLN